VIQSEGAVAPPVLASQSPVVRPARRNGPNRTACIDEYSGRSSEVSVNRQTFRKIMILKVDIDIAVG
jgi:hypothetical protein